MNGEAGAGRTVVLLHGIWLPKAVMWLLARRLQRQGFRTRLFGYRSLLRRPADNARRLAALIETLDAPVHLVGHSLGGIVILHALQQRPDLNVGRIVLLGSPVNGSLVAKRLQRFLLTRWLLGRGTAQALLGDGPGWDGSRALGTVSGTRPYGIGVLLGGLPGAHDGTVTLEETRLAGATDSIAIRTTHTGLVFSAAVADAVSAFLVRGAFAKTGQPG